MDSFVHVGGHSSTATQAVGKTILKILKCKGADQDTKRAALIALTTSLEGNINNRFDHCNFSVPTPQEPE